MWLEGVDGEDPWSKGREMHQSVAHAQVGSFTLKNHITELPPPPSDPSGTAKSNIKMCAWAKVSLILNLLIFIL